MDLSDFSTPVARRGPSSRFLQRKSEILENPGQESKKEQNIFSSPTMRKGPSSTVLQRRSHILDSALKKPDQQQQQHEHSMMAWEVTRPLPMNLTLAGPKDLGGRWGVNTTYGMDTDSLFVDFLATINEEAFGLEALDQVAELEELMAVHVASLKKDDRFCEAVQELSNERNTWRLLGKLYHDRLASAGLNMSSSEDQYDCGSSEKRLIEQLFRKEADLRQAQALVDWLEANARDDLNEAGILEYFCDATVSWENTLALLEDKASSSSSSSRPTVTSMDPDAQRREGRPLHDLDAEDQSRLLKAIFLCVRSGRLEAAQDLCVRIGQPWRAATLEGWKLYHDPNYDIGKDEDEVKLVQPVEGNKNRDLWKKVAWRMTEDEKLTSFERATYSALCGNIGQLLTVCLTWEDWLWAYVRCLVDVRVETEIRESIVTRSFVGLPERYWENKRSMDQVFDAIAASDQANIKSEKAHPYHVVQKGLINGDLEGLLHQLDNWIMSEEDVNPHRLRFWAHLVILLRRLNPDLSRSNKGCSVLRSYSLYLMATDRVQQVAWYVSQLPEDDQIDLYAQFLEPVTTDADRRLALTLALESGLPIKAIKGQVVQNIYATDSRDYIDDKRKVDALDWLLYDKGQRPEAVRQANTLTRTLVASEKFDMAKAATEKIPGDVTDGSLPEDSSELREHLAWLSYFRAKDCFDDWFEHFHRGRPLKPALADQSTFKERVGHEQKMKQYQSDLERWQSTQEIHAGQVVNRLMSTLAFAGGWLVDLHVTSSEPKVNLSPMDQSGSIMDQSGSSQDKSSECGPGRRSTEDKQQRHLEMDYLRKLCIPQLVLLLHSVLNSTGQFRKAVGLSDLVASEKFCLYEVYHKESMKELLGKIRESSLAAMETGTLDYLGYKSGP